MRNPDINKRRSERVDRQIFVRACQVKPPDPKASWDVYTVKNLSATGLLFCSSRDFETNAELDIRIMTPYIDDKSICRCRVVRSVPAEKPKGYYDVAVELTIIDEPTRDALKKTVDFYLKNN